MTVTVLTPTYNRADKLGILYDSLVSQTNKDFRWLIIDDAIQSICNEHEKFKNNNRICGYSFLRQYPDGKINGSFDEKMKLSTTS